MNGTAVRTNVNTMARDVALIIIGAWGLLLSPVVRAEATAATVYQFLDAQTEVYKTGSAESVERFVAFMSDDIADYHVAYDREFSGKDFYRKNMPAKAKALISFDRRIVQITMGTNVAVAVFSESTKERKPDGRVNTYTGRTIMVIEFDDAGLIAQIRRYQD